MSKSNRNLRKIENYLIEVASNYKSTPQSSLNTSRKILERIAKDICRKELDLQDSMLKNHKLDALLRKLSKVDVIPDTVKKSMGTIQIYGNFHSHDQDDINYYETIEFFNISIEALKHVLQWYILEYLEDSKSYESISQKVSQAFRIAKHTNIYSKQRELIKSFTHEELRVLTHKVKEDFKDLEIFKDKFTLYSIQKTLPEVIYEGAYQFEGDALALFEKEVELFREDNKRNKELTNEPHAIMTQDDVEESILEAISEDEDIEELPYWTTNYVGIRTLRHPSIDAKPQIISAGAITISPVERKLYFQQRGNKVATYKHHFHIMGGNYVGEVHDSSLEVSTDKADRDLAHTIFREILEESNINADKYDCKTGLYSIGREDDTGFIQVEAHAVCLLSERDIQHGEVYADITANWEGGIYGINFDSVEDFIKYTYDRWVPSGLAHVLVWLALGAPYAPELDGKTIYESVLNHIRGSTT